MSETKLVVEVDRSISFAGDEERWDIRIGKVRDSGGSYSPIPVSIGDRDRAERIAAFLRAELSADFEEETRLNETRWERTTARLRDEAEVRRVEEEAADAERREKIAAGEGIAVEKARCPECSEIAEPDEFDEPAYECGNCGNVGRGEDGRRCPQCNRFAAKVATTSCPSCETPIEGEPETVSGVEVDGVFVEYES